MNPFFTPPLILDRSLNYLSTFRGSLHSVEYYFDAKLLERVREYNKKAVIIVGGHVGEGMEEAFDDLKPDILVVGEGEYVLPRILKMIIEEGWNFKTVKKLMDEPGLILGWNGEVYCTGGKTVGMDLDEWPTFDYEAVNITKYYNEKKESIYYYSSKGCPFKCTICCVRNKEGEKVRYRSAKKVLEDLERITDKVHPKSIYFADDIFMLKKKESRDRILAICKGIIEKGLDKKKVKFGFQTRPDQLQADLLRELLKANFTHIDLGIESFSQKVLDEYNKGFTVKKAEEGITLAMCVDVEHKSKIRKFKEIYIYLIPFSPNSSPEDLHVTAEKGIAYMKAGCSIEFTPCAIPLPGTDLKKKLERDGRLKTDKQHMTLFMKMLGFPEIDAKIKKIYSILVPNYEFKDPRTGMIYIAVTHLMFGMRMKKQVLFPILLILSNKAMEYGTGYEELKTLRNELITSTRNIIESVHVEKKQEILDGLTLHLSYFLDELKK